MSIKSLFFKDEEVIEKPAETKSKVSKPSSLTSLTPSNPSLLPTNKNEFADFLNGVYQQGNFPGPDYQEFTDALKEVESAPMDERTKFTTIFAGFKVQGVTKQRLIDTGAKYVEMIGDQVDGFNKEIEKMLSTEVASKQLKIQVALQTNKEIEDKIQALVNTKNENAELAKQLNNEVIQQTNDLNSKKASFELAGNQFTANIQANIDKIKLYLL